MSYHLPPSQLYDHPINLDGSFVPTIEKVYPLTPEEQKVTEDFLEENLKSGKIWPLNSPQASSFFFVGKNDNGLWPCQDYRYIDKHMIKDTYPLSLISNFIDKVKDAKVFTKFDYLKPQLCSLDPVTPQQPSNNSWMTPSETWLPKDGLLSTWMTFSSPHPTKTLTLNELVFPQSS